MYLSFSCVLTLFQTHSMSLIPHFIVRSVQKCISVESLSITLHIFSCISEEPHTHFSLNALSRESKIALFSKLIFHWNAMNKFIDGNKALEMRYGFIWMHVLLDKIPPNRYQFAFFRLCKLILKYDIISNEWLVPTSIDFVSLIRSTFQCDFFVIESPISHSFHWRVDKNESEMEALASLQ